MTTPFIFIGTHKIKPGRWEEFKKYFAQFSSNVVEPEEPRLHSLRLRRPGLRLRHDCADPPRRRLDGDHMRVGIGIEHFATAYAEYLEPESTLQIYGNLTEDLIRTISAAA